MKVLVCGSRKWSDYEQIGSALGWLKALHPDLHIITGTPPRVGNDGFFYVLSRQQGADRIAASYAALWEVPHTIIEADWTTHGKAAGPIRNRQMLDLQPDLVLAFRLPGKSNGTDDTVREARRRGIPVEVYGPDGVSA